MTTKKRILVVDDDARVRFVVCGALKRLGESFEILGARDAQEALNTIANHPVDLMISDLRLPQVSGVQLTEKLRQQTQETPVIWVTAHGCYKVARDAERLGICDCLDKPIEIGAIREAALDALEPSNGEASTLLFSRIRTQLQEQTWWPRIPAKATSLSDV